MPFSNNLFLRHAFLHGFRNLSRSERFGLVEREGSASNSLHLVMALAHGDGSFLNFPRVLSSTHSCQV